VIKALQSDFSAAAGRHKAACLAGLAAASPVDSDRHPHRMPATCRPEKAARFVFPGLVVDAIHARVAAGSNLQ
jgi:hypothetical protein